MSVSLSISIFIASYELKQLSGGGGVLAVNVSRVGECDLDGVRTSTPLGDGCWSRSGAGPDVGLRVSGGGWWSVKTSLCRDMWIWEVNTWGLLQSETSEERLLLVTQLQ